MRMVRSSWIALVGGLLGVSLVTATRSLGPFWWRAQPSCYVATHASAQSDEAFSLYDASQKENVSHLEGDEVLTRIARLPIREWTYQARGVAIRHVGPTAQDFHAVFGLGQDPLTICPIDVDGIALRAIQALEARTRTQHEQMLEDTQSLADESGSLVRENAERIAELAVLRAEIASLRAEMR